MSLESYFGLFQQEIFHSFQESKKRTWARRTGWRYLGSTWNTWQAMVKNEILTQRDDEDEDEDDDDGSV